MKGFRNRRRWISWMIIIALLVAAIPVKIYAATSMQSSVTGYPKGSADDTSKDSAEKDMKTYSINYDPNEGIISYGTVGKVGACAENDTNNEVYRGSKFKKFPSDYENLTNTDGSPMFPGCKESGYDYTAMLTYAIDTEANNNAAGRDSYEIRIEEGVYLFKGALKVWGQFSLNGVYGKTVFVCEKNAEGALFKASSNQTYYSGVSITDITFVARGAHDSFEPTKSATEIHGNTLDLKIHPVEDYNCFQGMNISWSTIKNCTISGFAAPLAGVKGHMCSRIQKNTFGPCIVALHGLHFIDCYIYDNYFLGTAILRDTNPKEGVNKHMDLPLFTTGIGPNLTTINNNYIENFFYGKGESDTYGVSYTNNTYDHVYGMEFFSAGDSTNPVSQCLFKNNTYKDIAAFFEGLGYTPYTSENTGENAYVIHALSYDHNDNSSGKAFNKVQADNKAYIIDLAGGTTITQCKFEETDMTDTELFRFGYTSNAVRDKGSTGTQILDNAYKIDSYQKDDIFRDNINLKNNGLKAEWDTKYFLSKKASKEACVYYSPDGCIKIDMSCFFDPDNNETLGYKALSNKVGADEAALNDIVEMQYYNDIKAGKNVVYLSDFGATADDGVSDSMNIQKAFDTIAETGDILVVEGTYNITTPILLRGGKTYRIVGNGGKESQNKEQLAGGFCLNIQDATLAKTGAFVQDKDDTGKVSGYFWNINMNPNNIGQGLKCIERTGTAFYQVRFDKILFTDYRMGYMETVFEECTFTNSVIQGGYSQYNPSGLMNRCIFETSVLRHTYYTGSLCDYGIGYTYAYFLKDTDFVQSTMRGNWVEFAQMSNGFRFNGDGNSLYIGNIWDYVWNFQFGRNDIFTGNNLTHNATTSVTNHLTGPDNVARDKWTSEISAGNITSMHVSDGVRIVGNVFSDGSSQYTTYFNFDGRTTVYSDGGKPATSISNARIAGNLTGGAANAKEMVQVLCADTLVKENCRNNQIDLTSMAKSKKYIPATQTYAYSPDNYKESMIPGTLAWLWGSEDSSLYYYGEEGTPKALQAQPRKTLEFNLSYKLENTGGEQTGGLTVYEYDFVNNDKLVITGKDGKKTEETGNLISSYKDRVVFVSPFNENYKEPTVGLSSGGNNPVKGVERVLYSESAYLNSEPNANKGLSTLPPVYLFADEEAVNQYINFTAEFTASLGSNPVGDYPAIIYGEDDNYYYGVIASLQNSYALRKCGFKIEKSENGRLHGTNKNNGGVLPSEKGTANKASSTDVSIAGAGKSGNNVNGNVYFDGLDEEATKDNTTIVNYDPMNLNTPVMGMMVECNYGYTQNVVEIFVVFDFGVSYVPNDLAKKLTERKISLGTFSIEELDALPGIMFFTDAWIENISYTVDEDFDRERVNEINPGEEESQDCEHEFKEYIRVKSTCTAEGYDSYICSRCKKELSYEKLDLLPHDFEKQKVEATDKEPAHMHCICKVCGFEQDEPIGPQIIMQPVDVEVVKGAVAKASVEATGEGLKYQWYYTSNGNTNYFNKSSNTTATYSTIMDESRAGRKVYCLITDSAGNKVKSNVVTLKMKEGTVGPQITKQPVDVEVVKGAVAKASVEATGEGLKYQWYYTSNGNTNYFNKSSNTTATYSTTMDESRAGRKVYCLITDSAGNKVKSNVVTLKMKEGTAGPQITKQPVDVEVVKGAVARVSVEATGEGLKYQWYYTSNGNTNYFNKSSNTTAIYSTTMDESRAGRKVYCLITDSNGNKVKSNVVTLKMKEGAAGPQITKQPVDVSVTDDATATVTVEVTGDTLTYQWYYTLNGNDDAFYKSSNTTPAYSTIMNKDRDGRKVYCVIKDKDGNKVTTNKVTLSMSKQET